MKQTQIIETTQAIEELFKITMRLYWDYINALEELSKRVPDSHIGLLETLNTHMQDVQEALQHDIGVFDKAINEDLEEVNKIRENLKIQEIYNTLNK
ncbi:hypothetical protein KJ742_00840 [Patescibacteria group bacterium]|nr:hypothetical protein [Patescibacteria group bacterium]MBU1682469.1 hypothetical protein [Patescibacteria group bacterium]MBU1935363.1 hypothetical protein [Patescibacteria group bacterium]